MVAWDRGPQYYLFGAPGSAGCATVAKQDVTAPIQSQHCLLAGPATSLSELRAALPSGVTMADGHRLTIPQGTVVLQAANPSATNQIAFNSPSAQFYVLKDDVALNGADITNPETSTDQSGNPDVTFSFNSKGNSQFQKVTAQIAPRGEISSTATQVLDQHFAIALDNQLITVPLDRLQDISRWDHRGEWSRYRRSLHNPHSTRNGSTPARRCARRLAFAAMTTSLAQVLES